MHKSLGGAGQERTSVGNVLSGRGSCQVCSGSAGSRLRCMLTGILEPQGAVPQDLILLGRARIFPWCLRRSFLGECQLGPRHFWSHRACLGYSPVGYASNNFQAAWQYRKDIPNCCITPVFCIYFSLIVIDVDPKSAPQEENTEHGLKLGKIY